MSSPLSVKRTCLRQASYVERQRLLLGIVRGRRGPK